jgi:RND family efflux transporter MFP subunit
MTELTIKPVHLSIRQNLLGLSISFLFYGILVILLLGCGKTPSVKVIKAARTSVETTVTTISSGTVQAEEQAVLNFGIIGRVAEIGVSAGDRVRRGQRLASLENADLRVSAQAARAELQRVRDLAKEGLVSRAALDEAHRAAEVAQATYDKSVINAPFDGLITDVNLRRGEISQVTAGLERPPIRLIDLKPRLIKGEIDELDLGKVKAGQSARIKIPALANRVFGAKLSKAVPFVSSTREQDRTSQIELRFEEVDLSIPVGASAEVEIIIDTKQDAVTVPARAVLGSLRQRYVYRVVNDRLERVDVVAGIGNYDRREIVSGVSLGDAIVLPSAEAELNSGDKVKVDLQPWP